MDAPREQRPTKAYPQVGYFRPESFFFVAAVMMTVSLPFLPYTQLVILAFFAIAIAFQRRRPVILVLRDFSSRPELKLVQDFLPLFEGFGRVVWLTNTESSYRLLRSHRFSIKVMVYLFFLMFGVFAVFFVSDVPWSVAILGTIYIGYGSLKVLDYSVGNSPYRCLIFFALSWALAASSWGVEASAAIGAEHRVFLSSLPLATAYFFIASLRQRYYRGYPNLIMSYHDLGIFTEELTHNARIFSRFILDSPALVREIPIHNQLWRETVQRVVEKARYAAVDITGLKKDSGLAWEIEQCLKLKASVLYICHEDAVESANAVLDEIVGRTGSVVFTYSREGSTAEYVKLTDAMHRFIRTSNDR
jgi:hypothetical protein